MDLKLKKKFLKKVEKYPKDLKVKIIDVLKLLRKDPFAKNLNRHNLKGKLQGFESINVTPDIRIIIKQGDNYISVMLIGSHSDLY